MFSDRIEAGRALAAELENYLRHQDPDGIPLVLALPRGGVPVGEEVAAAIGADLDVVIARKISMPDEPEYGLGAVTADGPPIFHLGALAVAGLREEDLAEQVEAERAEARRRLRAYRGNLPLPRIAGRMVIVVDDGLATGVTAVAALRQIRLQAPSRLVFAAPVCSREGAENVRTEADALVCVGRIDRLGSVGAWYDDFSQLSDEDVEAMLTRARVS